MEIDLYIATGFRSVRLFIILLEVAVGKQVHYCHTGMDNRAAQWHSG